MKTWFFLDLISSVPMDYIFLMWDAKADLNQLFHAGSVEVATTDPPPRPPYWQGDHSQSFNKLVLHPWVFRFGLKIGQISPNWDKSGTFSDQFQYILALPRQNVLKLI